MKHVCVFCGSRNGHRQKYRQAAYAMGATIAQQGLTLVYGGGCLGLMGTVARSVLEHNGKVIGIIPHHLDDREGALHQATELLVVDSMHARKMEMSVRADAFVVLPGGFGTMDEFFEILTWRQIGLHKKSIFVLNVDQYWDPLKSLLEHVIGATFADEEHRNYVHFVRSIPELRQHQAWKSQLAHTPT